MQVNVDSEVDEVEYNVQGKGAKVMEVYRSKAGKPYSICSRQQI